MITADNVITKLSELYSRHGLTETFTFYLAVLTILAGLLLISFVVYMISRHVVLRILSHYIRNNRFRWDTLMLERKVFQRLTQLVPALILYSAAPVLAGYQTIFQRIISVYIIIITIAVLDALLNAADDIYKTFSVSRQKPIKGYLQGIKIFIFVVGGVIILARILGESPIILLSGIGAMTAVVLLIFQDSILGLVAGIQLATNDMVRIGDWIEMPKYNADGDVFEISLTTVKVANFDRTITTIPPHALVKDSFRNWRGVMDAGARRIMRAIYIDTTSIQFCSGEMLAQFRNIEYLQEYIDQRLAEIEKYNQEHNVNTNELVNGRRMTNIGTFRAYIQRYLHSHTQIRHDMVQMVRQLPPKEFGLPLELYMFTCTTNWAEYETIQADIFDHLLAVAPRFGLRIFQSPSGHDLRGRPLVQNEYNDTFRS